MGGLYTGTAGFRTHVTSRAALNPFSPAGARERIRDRAGWRHHPVGTWNLRKTPAPGSARPRRARAVRGRLGKLRETVFSQRLIAECLCHSGCVRPVTGRGCMSGRIAANRMPDFHRPKDKIEFYQRRRPGGLNRSSSARPAPGLRRSLPNARHDWFL